MENYFSGVLGREREVMDMVATGVSQGTRGGLYADASPKCRLFELPFLFADWEEVLRLAKRINEGALANGYHIPACDIAQGFRVHTNSVRPIRTPEDLRGLKICVPPQEVFLIAAFATGADPFIVNLEWYQRLPRELQITFDEVARETIIYSDQLNQESEAKYLDLLAQLLNTNNLTAEGLDSFRELSQVVYQHLVDKGDLTWDEIEEARPIAKAN